MRPNSCSIQAPTWRVDRGKLAATQAFKLSSCAALIKPALPPISKLVRPSIPPCSKSLRQPRIVSSSSNNALATSRQLHPSSKSTRAFARRVIRLAAAPSRANAISLLRSSSPRKPPRIMPPSESDQQRNARNFPEPSMSRGIDFNPILQDGQQHYPITVAVRQSLQPKQVFVHWTTDNWRSTQVTPCFFHRMYWDKWRRSSARNPNRYDTSIWITQIKIDDAFRLQYTIGCDTP